MRFVFALSILPLLAACSVAPDYGDLEIARGEGRSAAGRQISTTSWNIGYGALGADADFIADGGPSLRALPEAAISGAAEDIADTAQGFGSDFIFVQEAADGGFLTRGVPLLARLDAALEDYSAVYWQDFAVGGLPEELRVSHGMAVFARPAVARTSAVALPQEPEPLALWFRRNYGAIVSEVPIRGSDKKWVLINIHLSAFDSEGKVRREQAAAVFDFARAEYARGNYVVIAGDWNMRLVQSDFPHTTAEKYLFWLVDFPEELLPRGWRIGVDEGKPTVRTLQKPYVAGENYTAIIDGYAYSPNVVMREVETLDLGFRSADHNPVSAVFVAR